MTGGKWGRAWKCNDCGWVWWGMYKDGGQQDRDFCPECGGSLTLGAAKTNEDDDQKMAHDAVFKPTNNKSRDKGVAFVCSHCGAPNRVEEVKGTDK